MLSIIGVLAFLIIWQIAVMLGLVSSRYLSSPLQVINLFLVKLTDPNPDGAVLGINILSSLSVALTGFGLAIVIGIPLGLFMGWYRGFAAFVPCLINAYTGIRQTSQVLINVAKTCGASNFTIFRRIGIPSSFTMIFAGVRVALGNSWATLVAAEMLAASSGLGYMILMGRQFARPDLIILGIVVIGVIGVLLTFLLGLLENRILGWKKL